MNSPELTNATLRAHKVILYSHPSPSSSCQSTGRQHSAPFSLRHHSKWAHVNFTFSDIPITHSLTPMGKGNSTIYIHSGQVMKQNNVKNLKRIQFSRSVMSDSLRPHESQHTRPPCPSPTPGVRSDSRPSSQWCHPAKTYIYIYIYISIPGGSVVKNLSANAGTQVRSRVREARLPRVRVLGRRHCNEKPTHCKCKVAPAVCN